MRKYDHAHVTMVIEMTKQISKSQFKAKALEFFREVETTGLPMVITDHGVPKLELRPLRKGKRETPESLRGTVLRYDRPLDPVDGDAWEALR